MRENDFIRDLQRRFPVQSDRDLALDIADAMKDAMAIGRGSFTHEGVDYYIRTVWYDGCISGDCNPATCYTKWSLDTE